MRSKSKIEQAFPNQGRQLFESEKEAVRKFREKYAILLNEAVENMEERRVKIEAQSVKPDPFPFLKPMMLDQ